VHGIGAQPPFFFLLKINKIKLLFINYNSFLGAEVNFGGSYIPFLFPKKKFPKLKLKTFLKNHYVPIELSSQSSQDIKGLKLISTFIVGII